MNIIKELDKKLLFKLIEKNNKNLCYGHNNYFVSFKINQLKNKIYKKLWFKEKYRNEYILFKIDFNKKLEKLQKRFNDKKDIKSLIKFIKKRNTLSQKYGYADYNEIIISKIQSFVGCDFNLENFSNEVVFLAKKYLKQIENLNHEDFKVSEKEFQERLFVCNKNAYNLYIKLKQENKIQYNCVFENLGALTLFMPQSNDVKICVSQKKIDFCSDFIIHELGHVHDILQMNEKQKFDKIMINNPLDECTSSLFEFDYLLSGVKDRDLRFASILSDFIKQATVLVMNFNMEVFLNKQEFDEKKIDKYWQTLKEKFELNIKTKMDFTFRNYFNLSFNILDCFKYLYGKGKAIIEHKTLNTVIY